MLLLNLNLDCAHSSIHIVFTFQYASIKPAFGQGAGDARAAFTFQYASIKPSGNMTLKIASKKIYISICFY